VLLTANFIDKTDVRPHAAFLLDATGAWHVFARVVRLNKQTNSKILTMRCRRTAGLNLIKTLGRGNPEKSSGNPGSGNPGVPSQIILPKFVRYCINYNNKVFLIAR